MDESSFFHRKVYKGQFPGIDVEKGTKLGGFLNYMKKATARLKAEKE
jgi:hypothetical protein